MWANDDDPELCGMRHMMLLAKVYGKDLIPSGPLFRQIDTEGRVRDVGVVRILFP